MINHRGIPALLLPLLAGVAAHPAAAQAVRFTAPLEPGQVLRYEIKASLEMSSHARAEKLVQHAVLHLRVSDVDASGEATLRGAFEAIDATWTPDAGAQQSFTWKQGQKLEHEAPALDRAYGTLGATPIELILSPAGVIASVNGPQKALEAGEAAKLEHPDRALGVLAHHALPQTLAPLFTLDPDRKNRKPGNTWVSSSKLPALGAASIGVSTERTFKSIADSEALVVAVITQSWKGGQGKPDPTLPTASPTDQKITAEEYWNTSSGRLTSRTQDTRIVWTLQLQTTPPIQASPTVQSRVELRRLEPPATPAANP
jgi:hypothetical protein